MISEHDEFKHICLVLKASGVNIDEFVPDGKLHVVDELFFYIGFQNFSSRTGKPFYTLLYGEPASPMDFCSDMDLDLADRQIAAKRIKQCHAILKRGIPAVPVEKKELKTGMALYPLGFSGNSYFFTSTYNQQIVEIVSFSNTDLLKLMPLEYWASFAPANSPNGYSLSQAISKLVQMCQAKGIFQPRHIRGAGAWTDAGRIIINMGDHLVVDGKREELGQIQSRFFYTLGASLPPLREDPLNLDECDVIARACEGFRWIKSDYSFLMAGALVVSRVCGALPVRPHVWLTGGAQTGKTTLLERLIKPLLGESVLNVQGATSEAGIRQSLRANAIPVIFDEFETTGPVSAQNVASTIELMRASWSDSSASIIKGSASGTATSFQVRFSAIVSSIRVKLTLDADKSRFAELELAPHGSDLDHWKQLDEYLNQINPIYGDRLFARTVKMLPILLTNYRALKRALAKKVSQRFGDQYGMLLAGYSVLISDEILTHSEIEMLITHVELKDEREESKVTDHDDCLTHLLTKKIRYNDGIADHDYSVSQAIALAHSRNMWADEALQKLGIRLQSEFVCVASKHFELEAQIFRSTRWSQSWSNSLSRLPAAEKNKVVKIQDRCVKVTKIPLSSVLT